MARLLRSKTGLKISDSVSWLPTWALVPGKYVLLIAAILLMQPRRIIELCGLYRWLFSGAVDYAFDGDGPNARPSHQRANNRANAA